MRLPVLAVAFLITLVAACHQAPRVERVTPGKIDGLFSQASESDLANLVVCHDTLGRPLHPTRTVAVSRCTPCLPYAVRASAPQSVAHARRLWMQGARAPYDSNFKDVMCVRRAYQYARALRPDDDSILVELALVELANTSEPSRARALVIVDSVLQQRIAEGRRTQASNLLTQLGMGIWDRAQRMLERPPELDVGRFEERAHELANGAPLTTQLPPIPATSQYLGMSEAEWASRIFDVAARLSTDPASRSQRMRLALAPWVVLGRWASLDSAARSMLQRAPNDSAVLPARALAAYKAMAHPVLSAPSVMALFDSVVAHLPRSDSAHFDALDGVLSAQDDEWRYGYLPDQRIALDRRGWSVIDPLWSTPVNEIRLARRARVAEANYRYADIAKPLESGSETRVGQMLVRRGAPSPQWRVTERCDVACKSDLNPYGLMWMERSWRGLKANRQLEDSYDTWRVFYGPRFTPTQASTFEPERSCAATGEPFPSLYRCAIGQRADWTEVPFFGRTDDVDVTVARFRATGDSADVYIGARIPLRAFRSRDDDAASRTDRIEIGAWLTTELGAPVFHNAVMRELPAPSTLAWTHQWTYRAGSLHMMHRVEAMEPRQPAGARGIARFTSDAQVTFPLRGFGMSDVLIAASATPRQKVTRRWSDLDVQPNGASVAPNARFAMIWEVYDLVPGPDGRVHWRVRIKRERGSMVVREDMPSVLTGSSSAGTRVIASEADASDMSYVRDGEAGGPVLDHMIFGLGDAPPGHHVVNVTIDDMVSGKSIKRGVSVRVIAPESQKRGTKIGTPVR